ncbi:hypothetical protein ACM26M_15760 [Kluyvera cryocrescens]|uniref:hypothetical protein n=1 Tax=Kluyvera cryocrescens TaxID=580 RepID=UPI0039F70351
MSAGTLTLTNNSAAVTGSGTAFNNELAAGDFIVAKAGGVTYTLPVKTIESDTALTLARNYNGPAVTAGAWTAMPRDTLNRISAQIAADTAYAIRQRVLEIDNWYQLLEVNGNVTIKMADGSSFSGPSWKKIADLLEAIDESALQALATQVHNDAEQVTTDKNTATQASETAIQAKIDSQAAKLAAETAESGAGRSNVSAAQHASDAEEFATTAALKATEAANSAASVHPENLLQNANNLDDLTDKPAARQNLDVFSKEEIADMLPGFLGQIDWQEMRTALEPGTAPRDGQEVDQTGIFADLYAKALAGKLPTCTEAEWQADPLNRGCYVLESSPGKMRLPDDNGVQPGSLKIPVHVGDGGDSSVNGRMEASALPNIKGTISKNTTAAGTNGTAAIRSDGVVDGAFELLPRETTNPPSAVLSTTTVATGVPLGLNAGLYDGMYQDGVTEIRPNRSYGCWTVRFAAKATNGGSIDALALATAIAAGDAELLAKIIATNSRIDYAMLDFGTMVKGQRQVIENPFGNSTPVEVVAEVYLSNVPEGSKWGYSGFIYTTSGGYGTRATYIEGEGIVVQCGSYAMSNTPTNTGSGLNTTITAATTNLPVRVHVRKITA